MGREWEIELWAAGGEDVSRLTTSRLRAPSNHFRYAPSHWLRCCGFLHRGLLQPNVELAGEGEASVMDPWVDWDCFAVRFSSSQHKVQFHRDPFLVSMLITVLYPFTPNTLGIYSGKAYHLLALLRVDMLISSSAARRLENASPASSMRWRALYQQLCSSSEYLPIHHGRSLELSSPQDPKHSTHPTSSSFRIHDGAEIGHWQSRPDDLPSLYNVTM